MHAVLTVSAIALALLPVASNTRTDISPLEHPAIQRVDCMAGKGTAFYVSEHIMVSVDHVTGGAACYIGNKPFKVLSISGDFSVVRPAARSPKWLRIDCNGFVPGRKYLAIGHARGLPTLTEVELTATAETIMGLHILEGVFTVVPGQSGGPVVDAITGRVVGTVNRFNALSGESASVELKSTSVCQRA